MNVNLPRAGVVLALCTTLAHPLFAQEVCNHPRIISVTGNAEIKVAPDEVVLMLGVDSHDKDLSIAKVHNDTRIKSLLNLAHAAGVDPKDIRTSALTMGPEYSEERVRKVLGYEVSQTVTLTLTDLSKYESLMTNSLKAGVNRVDGASFVIADPKKYKEEARLKAVQSAREKAVTMAAQLGQTVGKPWEMTEGEDVDSFGKAANLYISYGRSRGELEDSTVSGGEVTIHATVQISFQLE
jgi:uncharacterized protein